MADIAIAQHFPRCSMRWPGEFFSRTCVQRRHRELLLFSRKREKRHLELWWWKALRVIIF